MKIGIYKIENLINHKCYIGQSVNILKRWDVEIRDAFDKTNKVYQYPLSRAFRKYGINNFSFEIVEECSKEELNKKEKYWINYYNSFFNGYNQTLGGDGGGTRVPKEDVIGIFSDLENTDMIHSDIAKKWNVSIEMVQGINTGRYWHVSNKDYPIQERCKSINNKKGKGRTKLYCQNCGMELSSHKAQLCIDCAHKASRKVIERPSRKELKILIREQSFTNIAKKYGVSDNAIRKWCDSYDLPRQKYIIKKFSNEEWERV